MKRKKTSPRVVPPHLSEGASGISLSADMASSSWEGAVQLYEDLCSSSSAPGAAAQWWDAVVILAADEPQRRFYEAMVACRRSTRLLPPRPGCEYVVAVAAAREAGVRAEEGAVLADALARLDFGLRERGGGEVLADKRVLVVDGAGYAARIPNLNVKGTLFAPLPVDLGVAGLPVGTVFDYKMIELAPVVQSCGGAGVFVARGEMCGPYDAAAQAAQLEQGMVPSSLGGAELRACLLEPRPCPELAIHDLRGYTRRAMLGAAALGGAGGSGATQRRASCSSADEACAVHSSAAVLASDLAGTCVEEDAVVEYTRIMGPCAGGGGGGGGGGLGSVLMRRAAGAIRESAPTDTFATSEHARDTPSPGTLDPTRTSSHERLSMPAPQP